MKQRYLEKISTIVIDPVLIEGRHFDIPHREPDCLPRVESTDLLCCLVLESCFYTQQQFKAFRSLEAYNKMVSGFKKHTGALNYRQVVLAKVEHSQRINDTLISVWIITENDGTINSAYFLGCKARLAESCSHVVSILFTLKLGPR